MPRLDDWDSDPAISLLDALPPDVGMAAVMHHVYVDESGTHEGSKVMTMACYLFEGRQARMFSRDWHRDLSRLGLSCAHMTDCAVGFGEYRRLTLRQRIHSEKLLIKHIRKRSVSGLCISMHPNEYEEIMGGTDLYKSSYTFLLMLLVTMINRISVRDYNARKMLYIFESGHAKQSEANKFMSTLPKYGWGKYYSYAGHGFMDKKEALPLQAADMLAWQHRHYLERRARGKQEMRKDFQALVRPQDLQCHVDSDRLSGLRAILDRAKARSDKDPIQFLIDFDPDFSPGRTEQSA